eukprot:1270378-Prymnesium_polylepis.1
MYVKRAIHACQRTPACAHTSAGPMAFVAMSCRVRVRYHDGERDGGSVMQMVGCEYIVGNGRYVGQR